MGWNQMMEKCMTSMLKRLYTRRAPSSMSGRNGCKKLKILLSSGFLRVFGANDKRKNEAHRALPPKIHGCGRHHSIPPSKASLSLAKDVKLSLVRRRRDKGKIVNNLVSISLYFFCIFLFIFTILYLF